MAYLEEKDRQDRADGTPKAGRLRQITPDTGKFLAILAATSPPGDIIEIGTSAGYSTLWLALAAKETNRKIRTFEILPEKARLAKETFRLTGADQYVELIEGDFLPYAAQLHKVAFCFLDAEKEVYEACFRAVAPSMVYNGLIVADNATSHYDDVKPMMDIASGDERFDCLTVPIGKGEFICRRTRL